MADRNKYDVLEFVKELAPEMDLDKINMKELAVKREEIKAVVLEARTKEQTPEEIEATNFLEVLLDIEIGEEISGEPEIVVCVEDPIDEVCAVVAEDMDLGLLPVDPIASALVYEIQGGGNYPARLAESSNRWERTKTSKPKVAGKEYIGRTRKRL